VSNSSAAEIMKAYTTVDAQRAQLKISRVPARRAINSRASSRGPVDELIISNVKRAARLANVRPRMLRMRPKARRKTA